MGGLLMIEGCRGGRCVGTKSLSGEISQTEAQYCQHCLAAGRQMLQKIQLHPPKLKSMGIAPVQTKANGKEVMKYSQAVLTYLMSSA